MDKQSLEDVKSMPGYMTFRQSLSDFKPEKDLLDSLIKKIEDIMDFKADDKFIDTLDYLITLFRNKLYIDEVMPTSEDERHYLESLENTLSKLINLLDKNTRTAMRAQDEITQAMIKKDYIGEKDCRYKTHVNAKMLLESCQLAKEFLLEQSDPMTVTEMKLISAEEIAREFSRLNLKLSKTRGGKFEQCYKAFLDIISCSVDGKKLVVYVPECNYRTIVKAIDEFPQKNKYALLDYV
tara:strand:+ start:139 stop:852 length:714 start_codon:yes stop_codon:yes gene_type:complete